MSVGTRSVNQAGTRRCQSVNGGSARRGQVAEPLERAGEIRFTLWRERDGGRHLTRSQV